ncbi:hypothetical protein BSK59_13615 [Paenibacillus odorifer]|uniref:hypothetical protein n=1 Tax=Paenibacillus odorifer TaxID=189426 RepID=UPI00096D4F73|nr:hypothetical protein [Paenibacillus odorifer]OME55509.1 hypothetical protein BSK59_13615 [Paenibacillus odorifer]
MKNFKNEETRDYWSKRIYDEIMVDDDTYETLGFNYKKIAIADDEMVIDIQVLVTLNQENRKDNIDKTLHKIQKTLEILLKTDNDKQQFNYMK